MHKGTIVLGSKLNLISLYGIYTDYKYIPCGPLGKLGSSDSAFPLSFISFQSSFSLWLKASHLHPLCQHNFPHPHSFIQLLHITCLLYMWPSCSPCHTSFLKFQSFITSSSSLFCQLNCHVFTFHFHCDLHVEASRFWKK